MDPREPQHTSLKAGIVAVVDPTLSHLDFEWVRVAVSLFEGKQPDHNFTAVMTSENPLPGAWTLKASSPGIDRPLTGLKYWNNHAGRLACAAVNRAKLVLTDANPPKPN